MAGPRRPGCDDGSRPRAVLAFQRSSGLIAGYTGSIPYTDNGGRYRIGQLAQGRYDIEFFDCYN